MNTKPTGTEIYQRYAWRYTKDDLRFCPRCGHGLVQQALHIPEEKHLVCHGCEFILYLDPKLVVTGVVTYGDAVLLLRRAERPKVGKWGLPGGHVQRGEDPREALIKEVRQEAGVPVAVGHLVNIYTAPSHGVVQLVFAATARTDDLRVNIESYEGRFFSRADLPWDHLAFETTGQALDSCGFQRHDQAPAKPHRPR